MCSHTSEWSSTLECLLFSVQSKLELVTGASCASMVIEVYNKENQLVCVLDNENALIGSYPIDDGMRVHVSFTFEEQIILSYIYIRLDNNYHS